MAQGGAYDMNKRRREQKEGTYKAKPVVAGVSDAPVIQAPNLMAPEMAFGKQPDFLQTLFGPALRAAMGGGGGAGMPAGFAESMSGGKLQQAGIAPERHSLKELQDTVPAAEPAKTVSLQTHDNFGDFISDPATLAGLAAFAGAMFSTDYENAGQQAVAGITDATGAVARYKGNMQAGEDAKAKAAQEAQMQAADITGKLGAAYKDVNTTNFIPEYLVPQSQALKMYEAQARLEQARMGMQTGGLNSLVTLMGLAQNDANSQRQLMVEMLKNNPELAQDPNFVASFQGLGRDITNQSYAGMGTLAGFDVGALPEGATDDQFKKYVMSAQTPEDLAKVEQQLNARGKTGDKILQAALDVKRAEFLNKPAVNSFGQQADAGLRWVINNAAIDPAKAEKAWAQYESVLGDNIGLLDSATQKLYTNAKAKMASVRKGNKNAGASAGK